MQPLYPAFLDAPCASVLANSLSGGLKESSSACAVAWSTLVVRSPKRNLLILCRRGAALCRRAAWPCTLQGTTSAACSRPPCALLSRPPRRATARRASFHRSVLRFCAGCQPCTHIPWHNTAAGSSLNGCFGSARHIGVRLAVVLRAFRTICGQSVSTGQVCFKTIEFV